MRDRPISPDDRVLFALSRNGYRWPVPSRSRNLRAPGRLAPIRVRLRDEPRCSVVLSWLTPLAFWHLAVHIAQSNTHIVPAACARIHARPPKPELWLECI